MSKDDQLARLAEIAIADVDRVLGKLGETRVALATADEQLTSMRTGLVALKDVLENKRGAHANARSDVLIAVTVVVMSALVARLR